MMMTMMMMIIILMIINSFNLRNLTHMQGPRSSFQSAGADSALLKYIWGKGGCGVVDFKNSWPGVDSIVFNTVTTHQSFFLNSLTNEIGVSSKKKM